MDQFILQQLKNELINGSSKRGHPFKYFTLGTIFEHKPYQRKVVLRKVKSNLDLLFYTDQRSLKVKQIKENQNVSALFYHPKKMIQLQINGTAEVIKNPELLNAVWKTIPDNAKRDYTTILAPGTTLEQPEEISYLSDKNHFCMVKITPKHLEYLKLDRPHHLRVQFLKENQEWRGNFLTP